MDIILISTADWDNPFWTNKQHVTVELAALGHRVLYVESQGLRAPTATKRDMARICKRLKRGLRPPRRVRANVWVWSPLVIPFQGSGFVRSLNKLMLRGGLAMSSKFLGLRPELVWTYSPLTTKLFDLKSMAPMVYHAVDAIHAQPGMPTALISKAEEDLARQAQIIFTTALEIQDRLYKINPQTFYFSNVADFEHFAKARSQQFALPRDLVDIAEPRIIFVGAISSYKLDTKLVRDVALAEPDWSIVMIGDVGEGDPSTKVGDLYGIPNIHLIGPKPYSELPSYLSHAAVAIIPAPHNQYTASMFPMKFFEYLAAGLPVVSTRLPALQDYGAVACFADGPEEFRAAIASAVSGRAAPEEDRLEAAREQTYRRRTEKMMALVDAKVRQQHA